MQDLALRADTRRQTDALQKNAERLIFTWPVLTRKEKLKRGIRKYLLLQRVPPADPYYWPNALLAEGICAGRNGSVDHGGMEALRKHYDKWLEAGLPAHDLDHGANGMPLLALYEYTKEQKYLDGAEALIRYLKQHPRSVRGGLPYRTRQETHMYADSLGMICPFLCRYGALMGDGEAMELGTAQLDWFLKRGMDEKSGLPYHGFDSETGVKYGCIGWGRAVGWMMTGLAESLVWLPEERREYSFLCQSFRKLSGAVLSCQRQDGSFAWLLPALEGPADSSATAMIASALLSGLYGGLLENAAEDGVEDVIYRVGEFLLSCMKDGRVEQCSGECQGLGEYPQRYGSYPWSDGPALKLFRMMEGEHK